MRQVDCGLRVGERPNLVRLNKDSVARARIDPSLESLDVRYEDVVPDHLAFRSDAFRQLRESAEILLVERIFDAEQSVLLDETFDEVDLFVAGEGAVAILVFAAAIELGGGEIERGPDGE